MKLAIRGYAKPSGDGGWLTGDAEIAGGTEVSYTLADSDEGSAIKVPVTFTDDAGNEETLTSARPSGRWRRRCRP